MDWDKSIRKLPIFIFLITLILFITPYKLKGRIFGVINTLDSGPGSFRAAIDSSNANPGRDTIVFAIPSGGGVQTIFPLSQLTPLLDPSGVLIDGLTQMGATIGGNPPATLNLKVEIDGISAGPAHGIYVQSSSNRIQGLIINNFEQDGISIEAGPFHDATFNDVFWNIIGLDSTGMVAKGNGWTASALWAGVRIHNVPAIATSIASDNFVEENLISSNYSEGVGIIGPQVPGDVFSNVVFGNYIGTDITGLTDLGNIHEGVCMCEGTHDNVVDSNLISGNNYDGVGIQGFNNAGMGPPIQTYNNLVSNNIIGLAIDMTPMPNSFHGVAVGEYGPTQWGCADNNWIGPNNVIAHNVLDGVAVWEDGINSFNADNNLITQNSIYNNGGLGIDLDNDSLTFNDPADPDSGANQDLNYPVIDSAVYNLTNTTIWGFIDIDTDPTIATIEVFKANPDPTGYGEGEIYLGATTADSFGDWNVTVSGLTNGDYVTATTSNGNTSEFCDNIVVTLSGIDDISEVPERFELFSGYPNPFNHTTRIIYAVPEMQKVSIKIIDISGRMVNILVDDIHQPSFYEIVWNGDDMHGRKVPPGIYFTYMESGGFRTSEKLIYMK